MLKLFAKKRDGDSQSLPRASSKDQPNKSKLTPDDHDKKWKISELPTIKTGDLLLSKFHTITQLGHGRYGKVWQCWDIVEKKFVALKINKSNYCVATNEVEILGKIHNLYPNDIRRHRIIELSGFDYTISDFRRCDYLLFHTIGQDLFSYTAEKYPHGFPIEKVKHIIRQSLEGLDYIHTKCKIIHTDLKPENILVCYNYSFIKKKADDATALYLEPLNHQDQKMSLPEKPKDAVRLLAEQISEEEKFEKTKKKYYPWNMVEQPFDNRSEACYDWEQRLMIKICDFGNAISAEIENNYLIQTLQYRALEVIVDQPYNTPVDIWSLGCITYELLTGKTLFDPLTSDDSCQMECDCSFLEEILRTLGPMPEQMRKGLEKSNNFFENPEKFMYIDFETRSLYNRIFHDKEEYETCADELSEFIHMMLRYDPKSRPTAAKCLEHPWIKH